MNYFSDGEEKDAEMSSMHQVLIKFVVLDSRDDSLPEDQRRSVRFAADDTVEIIPVANGVILRNVNTAKAVLTTNNVLARLVNRGFISR